MTQLFVGGHLAISHAHATERSQGHHAQAPRTISPAERRERLGPFGRTVDRAGSCDELFGADGFVGVDLNVGSDAILAG